MQPDSSVKAGTLGGTLLILFVNIYTEDVIRTALLAAVGAVVSFCVSRGLRTFAKRWQKPS